MTKDNQLHVGEKTLELDKDWRPLSFSNLGETAPTGVVFAGYGMQVPASGGKWRVRQLRAFELCQPMGHGLAGYAAGDLARATARNGAFIARRVGRRRSLGDMGAKGHHLRRGANQQSAKQLIRFDRNASHASVSIAAISVSNEVALDMFRGTDEDLAKIQAELDDGSLQMGFRLKESS